MSNFGHDDGWRKTGHKSRTGTKRKKVGIHRPHRVKPTPYESDRTVQRRRRLNDLRAADLEDETYELDDLEPDGLADVMENLG